VDLQASKNSKGLQEQQSQSNSNTHARYSLTVSIQGVSTAGFSLWGLVLASAKPRMRKLAPRPWSCNIWIENGGKGAANYGVIRQAKKHGNRSIRRRKDPIEWQNSQQPGFRYFSMPAASRIFAGNFLFAENLHGLVFREPGLGVLPLQIDIVPVLRARKHNSVSFTHTS
jgi:hypothetical protein